MKVSVLTSIPRVLLGLIFVIFGLNYFLQFIPIPPAQGQAAQFMGVLFTSKFLLVVKIMEIVGGILLVTNLIPRFGMVLLAPIVVCIFLYHLLIVGQGAFQIPIVLIILTILDLLLDKEALPFLFGKR